MQSAFSHAHHSFASAVAAESNSLVVSIEYGLFPDRPIPACYDDCWAALLWVALHSSGNGPDPWINNHADLTRIFIAGNSAGGNITHYLAAQVGAVGLPGQTRVEGAILVHPFFGGTEDDAMWMYMCPMNKGLNDPRMKERKEDLERLGCERVLVFVAEKDHLMAVGVRYYEALRTSGWQGTAELMVNNGEAHCFYLSDSECRNAVELKEKFAGFIKG
ncbi:hypothetical protein MLD38_023336 [Melastoma candidum]|nr:hypothetical protein MLD38_023336 [Melastoma candidum]